jgi:hypothetical protein
MARPLDPAIAKIFKDMGMDPKDAVWDCHGTWIAYHRALEKVAAIRGIAFDKPEIAFKADDGKTVTILVTGHMGERSVWSFGEAAPSNNKNAYPWAMAEKRAVDRVILKLIGLHGAVYSEEEADDFKPKNTPANGAVKVTQSNVSKENWAGPLKKTELFNELKRLGREFESCDDLDQFVCLKNQPATKAVCKQAAADMPLEWAGPLEEGTPYKDYFASIEKKLAEKHPLNAA